MSRRVYRYVFRGDVSFREAVAILDLALVAVEGIHGEARARMDARFARHPTARTLVVDASTAVGHTLNQVLVGYLRRGFGDTSFSVSLCPPKASPSATRDASAAGRGSSRRR